MSKNRVLIIDDEPDIRELLAITISRMDLDPIEAETLSQARTLLQQNTFALCLTDMKLPDGNGLDLVAELGESIPDLPVIVITAYGNVESAVQALKCGAFDFLAKPVDLGQIRELVQSAVRLKDVASLTDTGQQRAMPMLLGSSSSMRHVRKTIEKLARSQAPVFITGESGVGKELAANLIHLQSSRASGPFIPVNCGAIPAELMESEFFGHKKGSFTGAVSDNLGLFRSANAGTLFLDEIAELPIPMQVKLLRAIQERTVRPVGDVKEHPVDVRLLSATHKNLQELVRDGEFRQDLYYRIAVIELAMPTLRERNEDIPELTNFLLNRICKRWRMDKPKVSDDALKSLAAYSFPGNVRELENILERAVTLNEGGPISAEHLQLAPPVAHETTPDTPSATPAKLDDFMSKMESDIIMKALEETRYNKTAAAKKLGITFRSLRYKLKKLGIE